MKLNINKLALEKVRAVVAAGRSVIRTVAQFSKCWATEAQLDWAWLAIE